MKAEMISVAFPAEPAVYTDAAFAAGELSTLGIDLVCAGTADGPDVKKALVAALERRDVVIVTGGPATDAIIQEAVASAVGISLKFDEERLQDKNQDWGEKRSGRGIPPHGCTFFVDNADTAPGCGICTADGRIVIVLPGAVAAHKRMFRESAAPFLKAHIAEESREHFGNMVYRAGADNLENVVVSELIRQKRRLATAESCTGGLLAKRLTDVPGASEVFESGVVTYSNAAKTRLLGVSETVLRKYGAVSVPTARAMAEGVRKSQGTDLGVGITGVAGPGGGTPEKPVGTVHIALSAAEGTWVQTLRPGGSRDPRDRIRLRASGVALNMVRRLLAGLPPVESDTESALQSV